MNVLRMLAACAAISASTIIPAKAEWPALGSVHLESTQTTVSAQVSFPARLEWLGFQALHGDVTCDAVHAILADGSRYQVWRGGRLSHGGGTADLPASASPVQRLDFTCRAMPATSEIQIIGDPGKYLPEWRRHPDWASKWSYRLQQNPSADVATRS